MCWYYTEQSDSWGIVSYIDEKSAKLLISSNIRRLISHDMRIDLCKKCGIELREYDDSEKCQTCGKGFAQFVCVRCQLVTMPQYHIHRNAESLEDTLEIVI